jgi:hypothetical protein
MRPSWRERYPKVGRTLDIATVVIFIAAVGLTVPLILLYHWLKKSPLPFNH